MNYLLLALALAALMVALIGFFTVIRVAIGAAHFNSGWATLAHVLYASVGGTVAVWLFKLAVNGQ